MKSSKPNVFTVGKIYEVKDNEFRSDRGYEPYYYRGGGKCVIGFGSVELIEIVGEVEPPKKEKYFNGKAVCVKTHGYEDGLTIDRIDSNGDYTPENCRWSDRKEQGVNKRSTKWITWNGETHTLTEWSTILNIPLRTLSWRCRNWSIEKAFTEPLTKRGGWH